MHVYMYTDIHKHTKNFMYVFINAYAPIYTRIYIHHIHIYIHIYTYIYIYILYIYTQTYTHLNVHPYLNIPILKKHI